MDSEKLEDQLVDAIDDSLKDSDASFKQKQQLKDRILEIFEDLSEEEKKGMIDQVKEKEMSRRSFMKALGAGAGGLALTSMASGAWGQWVASSQGVSDIDADTVDGVEAADLGGSTLLQRKPGNAIVTGKSYTANAIVGGLPTSTTINVTTSMDATHYYWYVRADTSSGESVSVTVYKNGSIVFQDSKTITPGSPSALKASTNRMQFSSITSLKGVANGSNSATVYLSVTDLKTTNT